MRALAALMLAGLVLPLAACGNTPVLRDDYMGKPFFEPDAVGRPVLFDENGNPLPNERERSLLDLLRM